MIGDTRNYLLQFLATLQGDKAVIGGLRNMETATKKYGKQVTTAGSRTQNFNDVLNKASKRALIVAPVWMALRTAMMGIIRTVGNIVRANLELEEQMARIRTVMSGTASEISAGMSIIERKIRDVASQTSASLKELAEAFYFLKTSNLDTLEALAGFEPTVNAMIGTGNSAKDMARAVAGMFNTMGRQMDDSMTTAEKFTKIADVLTYTYATQDVQMSELTSSYEKLAPYVAGLDDSFTDLVTMLGFLNTRLLRAGRTGRLTGRSILQLTKNANQLAEEFGITFAPDEPISFIKTLEKINEKMSGTTKLTAKEGQILQRVFATRGAVPVRLLLQDFDRFQEVLQRAREEADGFAEKMREIRMDTVSAQAKRLSNNLANIGGEFYAGTVGAGDVVQALKELNDNLEAGRRYARAFGDAIGWLFYNISQSLVAFEMLTESFKETSPYEMLIPPVGVFRGLERWQRHLEDISDAGLGFKSPSQYFKDVIKAETELSLKRKEQEKLRANTIKAQKESEQTVKSIKEEESGITALMKAQGANALDVARFRLENLSILENEMEEEKYKLELQKRQNKVIEAQAKFRKELRDNVGKAELDLLKTLGASELQILQRKREQIIAHKELMTEGQYLLALAENRRETQQAIAEETQKEKETAIDLAMQYQRADEAERGRLERFFELRKLDPRRLAQQFQQDMFDRSIIDEYWDKFSKTGQEAVADIITKTHDLDIERKRKGGIYPFESTGLEGEPITPTIPSDFEQKITQDIPMTFWANWLTQEEMAIQKFAEDFKLVSTGVPGEYVKPGQQNLKERQKIQKQFAELGITIPIENIQVEVDPKKVAEEAGEKIKEKVESILKDNTTIDRLAKDLRHKI